MRWMICARHAAGEFVGLRQQRALARDFLDLAGQRVVLQQLGDDLLGGQPSGMVSVCCTTLFSMMVLTTSARLALLVN